MFWISDTSTFCRHYTQICYYEHAVCSYLQCNGKPRLYSVILIIVVFYVACNIQTGKEQNKTAYGI
jgi:hypothetical protein